MDSIIDTLKRQFNIRDVVRQNPKQIFATVEKESLVPLVTHLKNTLGFKVLVLITAVDWIEDKMFQITYILNDPDHKEDLGLRTFITRDQAQMHSIHHLWKHAATFQREMKEMFGIDFPGSPGVDEPFLLEGWDDLPPMRRDFDTKKYSEETYFPRPGRSTNDPASYMKQKLYPND